MPEPLPLPKLLSVQDNCEIGKFSQLYEHSAYDISLKKKSTKKLADLL